jgi:hypothetical protein
LPATWRASSSSCASRASDERHHAVDDRPQRPAATCFEDLPAARSRGPIVEPSTLWFLMNRCGSSSETFGAGRAAARDEPAVAREAAHRRVPRRRADVLDDDVDAAAAGELLDLLSQPSREWSTTSSAPSERASSRFARCRPSRSRARRASFAIWIAAEPTPLVAAEHEHRLAALELRARHEHPQAVRNTSGAAARRAHGIDAGGQRDTKRAAARRTRVEAVAVLAADAVVVGQVVEPRLVLGRLADELNRARARPSGRRSGRSRQRRAGDLAGAVAAQECAGKARENPASRAAPTGRGG